MSKKGKVFVLVAPSGTGKSTIMERLKLDFPDFQESISYTTRGPRDGESHGVNYFFVSKDEFIGLRDEQAFIEWAEVHENFYGSSKKFVEDKLNEGVNLFFDIDVQGADKVKDCFNDSAQIIFIAPPSLDILRERLEGRKTDAQEVIEIRLKNAAKELSRKNDFDYLIINDDLDEAYSKVKKVIENQVGDKCAID
jgi:guanylate kinase